MHEKHKLRYRSPDGDANHTNYFISPERPKTIKPAIEIHKPGRGGRDEAETFEGEGPIDVIGINNLPQSLMHYEGFRAPTLRTNFGNQNYAGAKHVAFKEKGLEVEYIGFDGKFIKKIYPWEYLEEHNISTLYFSTTEGGVRIKIIY